MPHEHPIAVRGLDHIVFDEAAIRVHPAAHRVTAGALETRHGAGADGPSPCLLDLEPNTVELKGPPYA